MERSRRVFTAGGSLAALCLCAGAVALAEEDAPTAPGALGDIVSARSEGNDEAAVMQRKVDTISDETDELLAQYRTTLKQIDSIDLYNGQMRDLIAAQRVELASLVGQLDRVEEVGRSVVPLMLRMIDAIDRFVELDVPFLIKERTERIDGLHKLMSRADVTTSEKYRQIMAAYQDENEYGRTIEAYRDSLILNERETTVNFLRFGRIALVYLSLDEAESGVWSQEARAWVPLASSFRSGIRQGLRVARKATAPDLIRLPLPAATDRRGAS